MAFFEHIEAQSKYNMMMIKIQQDVTVTERQLTAEL